MSCWSWDLPCTGFSWAGLIYGFFDGVVVGALFAWLYNHLAQRSAEIQAVN